MDTFIIYKPVYFTSTLWTVNTAPVWSGDSLIFIPTSADLYSIAAISGGNALAFNLELYAAVPPHAQFQVSGNGSITNNDTIWMCGSSINVGTAADPAQSSSWNWSGPGGLVSTSAGGPITLTTPGTYILERPNACGVTRDTFQLVALPYTLPILGPLDTTFCNTQVDILLDPGVGWNYNWSPGNIHTQTLAVTDTGTYIVNLHNVCMSGYDTIHIHHQSYPLPDLQYLSGPTLCTDSTVVLNPSPGYTYQSYLWSTGATTPSISFNGLTVGGGTSSYSVTVTQGACTISTAVSIGFFYQPVQPKICVVTVNDSLNKNMIVWTAAYEPIPGDPQYSHMASYNIYKAVGFNNWQLVGNTPSNQEHIFIDNTSNPTTMSAIYKITAVDNCNVESPMSWYHKTILLSANQGSIPGQIPLNWNAYTDESGTFQVDKYYIYRGNTPSALSLYDSVPGYNTSYVDTGVYVQKYYQLGVSKAGGCNTNPVGKKDTQNGLFYGSYSNIISNNANGIAEVNKPVIVSIYPNPAKDNLTIEINANTEQRLEIVNLIGQTVYINIINKTTTINTSAFANGVYILKLSSDKETVVRKFVKE